MGNIDAAYYWGFPKISFVSLMDDTAAIQTIIYIGQK